MIFDSEGTFLIRRRKRTRSQGPRAPVCVYRSVSVPAPLVISRFPHCTSCDFSWGCWGGSCPFWPHGCLRFSSCDLEPLMHSLSPFWKMFCNSYLCFSSLTKGAFRMCCNFFTESIIIAVSSAYLWLLRVSAFVLNSLISEIRFVTIYNKTELNKAKSLWSKYVHVSRSFWSSPNCCPNS